MKTFAVAVFLGLVLACASVSAQPKEKPASVPQDVWDCIVMQDWSQCKKIPAGERKLCSSQAALSAWATKEAPAWMSDKAKAMLAKAGHASAACKLADPTMARGAPRSPVSTEEADCFNGVDMVKGTYFTQLRCCPPPTELQRQCWRGVKAAREAAAGK